MLTQKDIDAFDGNYFDAKNKGIGVMDPAPGNGWGCIPQVDLVRMVRRVAEEQGKTVTVTGERPSLAKVAAGWFLILVVVVFGVGMLLSLVQ